MIDLMIAEVVTPDGHVHPRCRVIASARRVVVYAEDPATREVASVLDTAVLAVREAPEPGTPRRRQRVVLDTGQGVLTANRLGGCLCGTRLTLINPTPILETS